MIKRAIWISVVFHLLVLLTISRFALQSSSPNVRGTLISYSPVPVRNVEQERESGSEYKKLGPSAKHQSKQSVLGSAKESKKPAPRDSDFGRFFPSTVESTKLSVAGPSVPPIEQSGGAQPIATEVLGLFRLSLARNARPFKAYPAIARENGWEGVVIVSVSYPLGLGTPLTALERSSGHAILDRQALDMVERALATTTLPEAMQGKRYAISLPIEYRLNE
ncbi:MAG: TonB, C-terminal [Proteobacteria bacterium]|nr:TonB, C-terminal [Pseudomonadota bacterium]